MSVTRRRALTLFGATLAAPYVLHAPRGEAAGTLKRLGKPILLGAGQSGGKHGVALAAFPNPALGFIAAWVRSDGGNSRNYIQYFRSDGLPLSEPIAMQGPAGTTTGSSPNGVFPIARPDGSALILFSAARDAGNEKDAVDIFSQRMSAARAKIGNPALVNTVQELDQTNPLGVRLSTGNFLAAWADAPGSGNIADARGRIISFAGAGITDEVGINPNVPGQDKPRSAAALTTGKSVVSYSSVDGDDWFLRAAVLDADAKRAHTPLLLKHASSDERLGSAALLAKAANQDRWLAIFYQPAAGASRANLFFHEFDFVTSSGPARAIGGSFVCDNDGVGHIPPNACIAGANLVLVQHYGLSQGKQSIQGLVVDIDTNTVRAPRIVIHRSATDTQPNAVVRLPQSQIYVSGYSDGDSTDSSTAKASIQRLQFSPELTRGTRSALEFAGRASDM